MLDDGDALVRASAPVRDLDLMSRRLDVQTPDVGRRRSEGASGKEPKGRDVKEIRELDGGKATTGTKAQDRQQLVFTRPATD